MPVDSAGGKGPLPLNKFKALNTRPTPEDADAQLKKVADLYEKQFLREMVKAMRTTVGEGGLIKTNQAEQIFKEKLDQEYVETWGNKGGIGLGDMIYKQLIDKYGPMLGLKTVERPVGPLKLREQDQVQMTAKQAPSGKAVQYELSWQLNKPSLSLSASALGPQVQSPWAGKVMGIKSFDEDHKSVELLHKNGLKSQLVYRGGVDQNLLNQDISEGQHIGQLSNDAKTLYWNVEKQASPEAE